MLLAFVVVAELATGSVVWHWLETVAIIVFAGLAIGLAVWHWHSLTVVYLLATSGLEFMIAGCQFSRSPGVPLAIEQ